MPVDFFEVKKRPRGTYRVMVLLAVATLIITSLAFLYLAIEGSKSTTTVSEVKTEDLSNKEGWDTCTMISKVNDEYALDGNASFTLVNVMESKTECASNLAAAAPCASFQFLASSDPSEVQWDQSTYGAIAVDPSDNLWALDWVSGGSGNVFGFNVFSPSTGKTARDFTGAQAIYYTSGLPGLLAVGANSVLYAYAQVTGSTIGGHKLVVYDPATETETTVDAGISAVDDAARALAVDTSGVVWIVNAVAFDGNAPNYQWDLVKYDPSTGADTIAYSNYDLAIESNSFISFAPSGDLWGYGNFNNCTKWEIYSPGTYYCNSDWQDGVSQYQQQVYKMFKYEVSSGEFSFVMDISSYYDTTISGGAGYGGFVVDSDGIAWLLFYDGTLLKYDTSSGDVSEIELAVPGSYCSGLAVDSLGDLLFSYLETSTERLYKYSPTSGTLSALQTYQGSLVWFVCGDTTQSTVPSTSASLLSACSGNGVKWSASVEDYNCFSSSEMDTWALSTSTAGLCTSDVYDSVCDVVAELPPYICTKEEKDNLTTYLGVAAANAELLYAALVFVCGLVLDYIGSRAAKSNDDAEAEGSMDLVEAGNAPKKLNQVMPTDAVSKSELRVLVETMNKKHATLEKKISVLEERLASTGSKF